MPNKIPDYVIVNAFDLSMDAFSVYVGCKFPRASRGLSVEKCVSTNTPFSINGACVQRAMVGGNCADPNGAMLRCTGANVCKKKADASMVAHTNDGCGENAALRSCLCAPQCARAGGLYYAEDNVIATTKTSLKNCIMQCYKNDDCEMWSWKSAGNICALLDAMSEDSSGDNHDMISGGKYCPGCECLGEPFPPQDNNNAEKCLVSEYSTCEDVKPIFLPKPGKISVVAISIKKKGDACLLRDTCAKGSQCKMTNNLAEDCPAEQDSGCQCLSDCKCSFSCEGEDKKCKVDKFATCSDKSEIEVNEFVSSLACEEYKKKKEKSVHEALDEAFGANLP
eukprot:GEMP01024669.1.p1 GENE.GEMP01024669.1~~GEMP01024669.1.p1  ORF type:complete len:337 (-),score=45.02 GEMP01024669.1:798-1808(-)